MQSENECSQDRADGAIGKEMHAHRRSLREWVRRRGRRSAGDGDADARSLMPGSEWSARRRRAPGHLSGVGSCWSE
jgi:hypothetical protein